MKLVRIAAVLCCTALVAGCASLSGRSTNDPAVMLQWASEDFSSRNEPAEAEKLILDALKVYQRSGDRLGRAEAYRQYGLFLRSPTVTKFKQYYVTEGFQDESIRFADRYEKAIEYFIKARDIFAAYKKYDKLSNVDISLAKTYAQLNRHAEACDSLAKSIENYAAYKQANPDMKEFHAEELADYDEYIGILETQLSCTNAAEEPAKAPASAPAGAAQ